MTINKRLLSIATVLISLMAAIVLLPKPEESSGSSSSPNSLSSEEGKAMTADIFGVKIERNPPQSILTELGVSSWPKWECSPSKFPWTFRAKETMYLLEGKVKVNIDGYDGTFEIGAGDLVEFPKGMNITWDVIEAVSKHYNLEK